MIKAREVYVNHLAIPSRFFISTNALSIPGGISRVIGTSSTIITTVWLMVKGV
jgi:hypothetical protein